MKTLDEVIKAYECCNHGEPDSRCEECQYNGIGACCLEREDDALRCLKEYKERKNTLRYWSEKAISELQNFADAYMFYKSENEKDNNPLTWEELKSMEGKPVWVEYNLHLSDKDARSRMWIIIQQIFPWKEDNELIYYSGFVFGKEEIGKTWQAYQKER